MQQFDPLTDDEECLLREMEHEKNHPQYPQEWLRACNISGPIGVYQARAFRGLLHRKLVERKRGGYANRNRRWLWRVTPSGEKLARELRATSRGRGKKKPVPDLTDI